MEKNFINPDLIARDKFGGWNSQETVLKAAQFAEKWREECLKDRKSLIFEIVSRYYKSIANCSLLSKVVDRLYAYDNDVVCAELYFGARNKRELDNIVADMEKLTDLTIFPIISKLATDLVKQYCLSHKLKLPDAQIAATALFHNAELFTLNRKDFAYIPNLKLYEPK